jgi:hypothetical protein
MKIWTLLRAPECDKADDAFTELCGWWRDKPSLDTIARTMGLSPSLLLSSETVDSVARVYGGNYAKIGDGLYRLRHLKEGPM